MSIFKCKMCGGTIEFEQGSTVGECDSCGTKQTLPKLDDDRRANLYDRANHFRRGNEFDKAMAIYENILNEDNTDAEAYWSLVLCRYGIEYVEDPASHKRVPTVNRAQFTSVFDDDNYKSALQYADGYQKAIYEEEAAAINEIQKGILAISQKEEPFDVFICYKETDNSGRRTQDSVLANDLYHQLTNEGFKVFFARITLEDKLGTAYEPYIFAALNSAKVMVVLGTRQEYFNAVWVKNEWSRYLSIVKQSGGKKVLIPAYRDMDPYDLPEEFSHLQAQDMSKLGFMQDLIRGIKKITDSAAAPSVKETVVVSGGNSDTAPLLKRAFMYLEDRDWSSANDYCERVLDIDPENAQAYLGKLLAEMNISREDQLSDLRRDFSGSKNYQKAVRFGNQNLENFNKKAIYNGAVYNMNSARSESDFKSAADIFKSISGFEDADTKAAECLEKAADAKKDEIYNYAKTYLRNNDDIDMVKKAERLFRSISEWRDSAEQIEKCNRRIEEIKQEEENARLEEKRKQEEAIALEKRKKKQAIIAGCVAVLIVGFAFLSTLYIIPEVKYNNAIKMVESGQYDEAVEAFTAMDYKDSADWVIEAHYQKAISMFNNGQLSKANTCFAELGNYKDSLAYRKKYAESLWESLLDYCQSMRVYSYDDSSTDYGDYGVNITTRNYKICIQTSSDEKSLDINYSEVYHDELNDYSWQSTEEIVWKFSLESPNTYVTYTRDWSSYSATLNIPHMLKEFSENDSSNFSNSTAMNSTQKSLMAYAFHEMSDMLEKLIEQTGLGITLDDLLMVYE